MIFLKISYERGRYPTICKWGKMGEFGAMTRPESCLGGLRPRTPAAVLKTGLSCKFRIFRRKKSLSFFFLF